MDLHTLEGCRIIAVKERPAGSPESDNLDTVPVLLLERPDRGKFAVSFEALCGQHTDDCIRVPVDVVEAAWNDGAHRHVD